MLDLGILPDFGTPAIGVKEPFLDLGESQGSLIQAHPAPKLDAVLEQVPVVESAIQPEYFVFHL